MNVCFEIIRRGKKGGYFQNEHTTGLRRVILILSCPASTSNQRQVRLENGTAVVPRVYFCMIKSWATVQKAGTPSGQNKGRTLAPFWLAHSLFMLHFDWCTVSFKSPFRPIEPDRRSRLPWRRVQNFAFGPILVNNFGRFSLSLSCLTYLDICVKRTVRSFRYNGYKISQCAV